MVGMERYTSVQYLAGLDDFRRNEAGPGWYDGAGWG